jgi:hypothetical protein
MQSTNTTRDLIAGARTDLRTLATDLRIVTADLRTLAADLRTNLGYLRTDLRYDWLTLADRATDLADNLRADLVTWCQQHAGRQLAADPPEVPQ